MNVNIWIKFYHLKSISINNSEVSLHQLRVGNAQDFSTLKIQDRCLKNGHIWQEVRFLNNAEFVGIAKIFKVVYIDLAESFPISVWLVCIKVYHSGFYWNCQGLPPTHALTSYSHRSKGISCVCLNISRKICTFPLFPLMYRKGQHHHVDVQVLLWSLSVKSF